MLNIELLNSLRCPECLATQWQADPDGRWLRCTDCQADFSVLRGRPLLIKGSNRVFRPEDYLPHGDAASPQRRRRLVDMLPRPSVNLSSTRLLTRLREGLDRLDRPAMILVVGGGSQRVWLDPLLKAGKPHRVIYTDIDVNADVDVFCDAHELPWRDASVDAVITTAVLEHVIQPQQVAAEIARVTRAGGVLYSELPFMQQVHEGAYDFTRFTLGGHRRLFHEFTELDAGMTAGPATALVWSIENFLLAFARRTALRKGLKLLSRLVFSPLKYLDYWLVHNDAAMDGASCTYFFGVRADHPVADEDIIHRYVGAKHLKHV